jgi:hypothetical protein
MSALQSLFRHQLLLRLLSEVIEFKPYAIRSEGRVLGAQVVGNFGEDMLVAARFELGCDHPLGILFGGVAEQPQTLRRPEPQQSVAPGGDLEFELLIVLEPSLEFLLAVSQSRHGVTISRMHRIPRYHICRASTPERECAPW